MYLIILGNGSFAKEITDELPNNIADILYVTSKTLPKFKLPNLNCYFIAAIISTERKGFIEQFSEQTNIKPVKFIHPTVYKSKTSSIGVGSIVCPNVVIASYTLVCNHVIVNRGTTIGHDCQIGSYSTIGPGVNIAGDVRIGEQTTIGIGTNILEGRTIGNNCVIGAGSLVTKDVPDNEMWYGVPAKHVRKI